MHGHLGGPPELRAAAVEAVGRWRYKPARMQVVLGGLASRPAANHLLIAPSNEAPF
jgi:hypothetical protein